MGQKTHLTFSSSAVLCLRSKTWHKSLGALAYDLQLSVPNELLTGLELASNMRQQFLVVLSLSKATRGPCCTRGPRVGGSSGQKLGEVMSDMALTVVRQSNKGQKEENREAKHKNVLSSH